MSNANANKSPSCACQANLEVRPFGAVASALQVRSPRSQWFIALLSSGSLLGLQSHRAQAQGRNQLVWACSVQVMERYRAYTDTTKRNPPRCFISFLIPLNALAVDCAPPASVYQGAISAAKVLGSNTRQLIPKS